MKVKFCWDFIQPCNAQLIVFFDPDTLLEFCAKHELVELSEDIHSNYESYSEGMTASFWHNDQQPLNYVMLLPDEYVESVVWHEALHLTTRMWEQAGAELHFCHNDEVLTYTQGHVVEVIKRMYQKRARFMNGTSTTGQEA